MTIATSKVNLRNFLKTTGAGAAGLLIGFYVSSSSEAFAELA
jgi:hypothetical protein